MRKRKIIAVRSYKGSQSLMHDRIEAIGDQRYRVLIKRDAYDLQSHLRGFVYSTAHNEWKLLVDRPIEGAACSKFSYVQPVDVAKSAFEEDAESVISELEQIVY